MKYLTVTFVLFTTLFIYPSCKDKCNCRELEDCIDRDCVLRKNCYYLNNQGILGTDLYHGVVEGNDCVDTLVLNLKLNDPNPTHKASLFAVVPPYGAINVAPDFSEKISDTEYTFGSVDPICYQTNLVYWYASYIHCKLFTDSVQMFIGFRQSNDLPNAGFIDSCKVTLYK